VHTIGTKPGGRLVQTQHPGVLAECDRDFERAAVAVGKILGAKIAFVG
jgi:hypothetical protein